MKMTLRFSDSIIKIIRFFFPLLVMTRAESLEAIKALQAKLNESKENTAMWRTRALSAEKIISRDIPQAIKKTTEEHDDKHGTCLSWRV